MELRIELHVLYAMLALNHICKHQLQSVCVLQEDPAICGNTVQMWLKLMGMHYLWLLLLQACLQQH